jgi:cell division protein FtsN
MARSRRDFKARRGATPVFSGWMGALCGLAVGLAVAAVIYVKDHRGDAPTAHAGKPEHKRPHGTEPPDTEGGEAGAVEAPKSYAFYDRLPKFAVVVPEKGKDVKPDAPYVPETRRGTYVLQAGAYKSFADAEHVRRQLPLQGVESKVQQVSADKQAIRIGPVSNLDELNRLRQMLRKAAVETVEIRVGD